VKWLAIKLGDAPRLVTGQPRVGDRSRAIWLVRQQCEDGFIVNDLASAAGGFGLHLKLRLVIGSTRDLTPIALATRSLVSSAAAAALTSGESHRTVPCLNLTQTACGAHNYFLWLKVKAVVVALRH